MSFKFGTLFAAIEDGWKQENIDIFPFAGYYFFHFRENLVNKLRREVQR